jgi:hypothetical protein
MLYYVYCHTFTNYVIYINNHVTIWNKKPYNTTYSAKPRNLSLYLVCVNTYFTENFAPILRIFLQIQASTGI